MEPLPSPSTTTLLFFDVALLLLVTCGAGCAASPVEDAPHDDGNLGVVVSSLSASITAPQLARLRELCELQFASETPPLESWREQPSGSPATGFARQSSIWTKEACTTDSQAFRMIWARTVGGVRVRTEIRYDLSGATVTELSDCAGELALAAVEPLRDAAFSCAQANDVLRLWMETGVASRGGQLAPGFYSFRDMRPAGIYLVWPSPWNGGATSVFCDVPDHEMYARHVGEYAQYEVKDLAAVRAHAPYWSRPCSEGADGALPR